MSTWSPSHLLQRGSFDLGGTLFWLIATEECISLNGAPQLAVLENMYVIHVLQLSTAEVNPSPPHWDVGSRVAPHNRDAPPHSLPAIGRWRLIPRFSIQKIQPKTHPKFMPLSYQ